MVENIDLNLVLKTAESVCSALGFKLGMSWGTYVTELPKFPWTSIYLTSLELGGFSKILQQKQLQDRILYAIYYGLSGLKWKYSSGMEVVAKLKYNALKPLSENKKNHKKSPLLQKANSFQIRSQRIHDQNCKDKTGLSSSDEENRRVLLNLRCPC